MTQRLGFSIEKLVRAWVAWVARHALLVLALSLAGGAGGLHYAAGNLGVNTDTADMIARDLDWRQDYIAFQRAFPLSKDNLTVVIDGPSPEVTRAAATRLAHRLSDEPGAFTWVYAPTIEPFFQRNGLLYKTPDELADLGDRLAEIQPLLARLSAKPRLKTLLDTLIEARKNNSDLPLEAVFGALARTIGRTLENRPAALSWHNLMRGDAPDPHDNRQILIVHPKVDFSDLLPAKPAMARIRALADELTINATGGLRLRITGGLAMSTEELDTVSRGMGIGALAALALVLLVLSAGMRSPALVIGSLVTLLVGLCWTAAFAAAAVGHLNLISVAFAVLYIGLGIDYAAHFGLRYRELLGAGHDNRTALSDAAGDVGVSLVLCAVTTGIGFFAFVPTEFAGVSELGLISGTGMFISLAASLTVLPAWLTLWPARPVPAPPAITGKIRRRPGRILAMATVITLIAAPISLASRFDRDPINLRAADSESVATYRDLARAEKRAPLSMELLADDSEQAAGIKQRLQRLDSVSQTRGIADFIPDEQADKLAIIEDIALTIGPLDPPPPAAPDIAAPASSASLEQAMAVLGTPSTPAAEQLLGALRALRQRLNDAADAEDVLRLVERAVFRYLPDVIAELNTALEAQAFSQGDLPTSLRQRWIAGDGRYKVEAFTELDLENVDNLARFVSEVRGIYPSATGSPVVNLESGNAVVRAFIQAFVTALALIALLLLFLLDRRRDIVVVLAPLVIAGLWTLAIMVVLDMPFNFANVITLPLLLGVGVDNGIHVVHRYRTAGTGGLHLLGTSTGRAVVVSALTTLASFGNLAFSHHPGTASMGQVLTLGLLCTLIATLWVLPAWLERQTA